VFGWKLRNIGKDAYLCIGEGDGLTVMGPWPSQIEYRLRIFKSNPKFVTTKGQKIKCICNFVNV